MKTMPALLVLAFSVTVSASFAQMSPPATPSHARTSCSRLPIYFIENRGRFPDHVALYVQGNDKMIFFARDGITIQLKGPKLSWAVKLVFVDANPDAVLQGEDRQQAVFSYFSGKEEDWKAGLKTYSRVVYHDLWPGIDLVYQGTVNHLKYEFRVQPGADPNRIRLRYEGASRVTTTDAGGTSGRNAGRQHSGCSAHCLAGRRCCSLTRFHRVCSSRRRIIRLSSRALRCIEVADPRSRDPRILRLRRRIVDR